MRILPAAAWLLVALAPVSAGPPAVALLDPDTFDRAALLEARLLGDPRLTPVERTRVDAALREQELQAAFGPRGVARRVRLGAILKADILVLVRPVKDVKEPTAELVVCETAGGLRLASRLVPVTPDAGADTAALVAAFDEALAKYGQQIRQVVAVPPFVSGDLGRDRDHLKAAFARLAERAAAERPGVVAVELAEAEALAAELRLAAPGTGPARPLPTYLLGEFRHGGTAATPTVTLTLRAGRAGEPEGGPARTVTVPPGEAAAVIRAWAGAAAGGGDAPASDPKAEAALLAGRAKAFRRVGDWEECVALAEAALLLDPSRLDLHIDAMMAVGPPIQRDHTEVFVRRADPGGVAERYTALYLRGLAHFEAFLEHGGDPSPYRPAGRWSDLASHYRTFGGGLHVPQHAPPHVEAVVRRAAAMQREVFRRLLPRVAHLPARDFAVYVRGAIDTLPYPDQVAAAGELLKNLRAGPEAEKLARAYGQAAIYARGTAHAVPQEVEGAEAQLAALQTRLAAPGATRLEGVALAEIRRLDKEFRARSNVESPRAPVPPDTRVAAGTVALTPIRLTVTPDAPEFAGEIHGLVAAGDADVLWDRANVYLMREKGVLRRVHAGPPRDTAATHGVYDGQYVWVVRQVLARRPTLLVIDPATGRMLDVSDAEGLPRPPADYWKGLVSSAPYALAPLGPGRIGLAGAFGGRAWVGVATFDPAAGAARVKVVHEAREAPDRFDPDAWKRPGLAFFPVAARTLRGGDGQPRVLIVRGRTEVEKGDEYPLLVDPDAGTAEVAQGAKVGLRSGSIENVVASGDALYYVESTPNPTNRLMRARLPGLRPELVASGFPGGQNALPHEGRWHLVSWVSNPWAPEDSPAYRGGGEWWVAEKGATEARLFGRNLPNVHRLVVSAHYGLVALASIKAGDGYRTLPHAVEVSPPAVPSPPR